MATWLLTREYVNGNTVTMCGERKQITTRPDTCLFSSSSSSLGSCSGITEKEKGAGAGGCAGNQLSWLVGWLFMAGEGESRGWKTGEPGGQEAIPKPAHIPFRRRGCPPQSAAWEHGSMGAWEAWLVQGDRLFRSAAGRGRPLAFGCSGSLAHYTVNCLVLLWL